MRWVVGDGSGEEEEDGDSRERVLADIDGSAVRVRALTVLTMMVAARAMVTMGDNYRW